MIRTLSPALALLLTTWCVGCDGSSEDQAKAGPEPSPGKSPPPEPEVHPPPNILWVTIDTLRPDHLSAYGYARDTSPHMSRLAREGVRFDRAAAQGPWTFSSIPSIITSLHPQAHHDTIVDGRPDTVIESDATAVASVLQERGYRTELLTGHGAIGAIHGLCRGFDVCNIEYESAEQLTDRALAALAQPSSSPRFLWVYYIDPHIPYWAPAEFTERYVGDGRVPATGLSAGPSEYRFVGEGAIPYRAVIDGERSLDFYVAAYDGQIRYVDHHLGRLLAGLGDADRGWVTMVFADHGESLTEHGLYLSHTLQLYDTILRVPWLVHWPGVVPAETEIDVDVMAIDIGPTLLGLLDIAPPAAWVGHDLSACVRGAEECVSRPGFAARRSVVSPLIAMWRGPFKVICNPDGESCELYDRDADPGETVDLCGDLPQRCRRMATEAREWHAAQPTAPIPASTPPLPADTREALRALGYTF